MMNFRVTAERAPLRCEICHQTDCFDAATGKCARCIDISPAPVFAGGQKFEPGGIWPHVRWLIWFLVIGVSVWGGIYKQLSWAVVSETRDPELFAMTDFEGAVPPQPGILKSNDGVIRAWNLYGGAHPFLHDGGVSYPPVVRFFGKVVSYESPTEFENGNLLLEEGPGRILSVEISSFYIKDFLHHRLIEEAFQPGRFIRADCVAELGLFCGNTTRSEWIQARDMFEGWQPGSPFPPKLDSFESDALIPSDASDGNQAPKAVSPVPPSMPPRDRTSPYFIREHAGAISGLCGGYDAFPTRTFTGQIVAIRKKSQPKTNYLFEFRDEKRGRVRICTDLRSVAAAPVTWNRFEKMIQAGNRAKITVRVVYGGVFVLDSIENDTW